MAQVPNVVYVPQTSSAQSTSNAALPYTKIYKRVGITQLVFGGLSVVLGTINVIIGGATYFSGLAFCGAGIWAGGMMIAAGVLGVKAEKNPTKCIMIAGITVSICAAIFAAGMVCVEAIGADNSVYRYYYSSYYVLGYYYEARLAQLSFHVILAAIAFGELITAIVHSAYCCAGYCGESSSSNKTSTANNQLTGQVMYVQAGQPQQQYGQLPQNYVIQGQPNPAFVTFQQPTVQPSANPGATNLQQPQADVKVITQPPQYAANDKL